MKTLIALSVLASVLSPNLAYASCPDSICGATDQPPIPAPTTPTTPAPSNNNNNNNNGGNGGGGSENNSTENNSNQNNDSRQELTGQQSNVQINNANIGNFSFGNGITCSTAQLAVNANATGFNSVIDGYSVGVSYLVPLGGSTGRDCRNLSAEIVRQRQLDTNFVQVEKCLAFQEKGVNFDSVALGSFGAYCKSILTVVVVVPTLSPEPAPVVVPPAPPKAPEAACKPMTDLKRRDNIHRIRLTFKDGIISKAEAKTNAVLYDQLTQACFTPQQIWTLLDP